MTRVVRDPAYVIGLGLLIAVIVLSLAVGRQGSQTARALDEARGQPHAPAYTTPAAVTPTLPQAFLDLKRALDLKADGTLLEIYRGRFGAYPSSGDSFTTFCTRTYDPGCQLKAIASDVPAEDELYPYWYRSDGTSFTLFAQTAIAVAQNGCPDELPPPLIDVPVLCVSSAGGRP